MSKAETIRSAKLGKKELRLVRMNGRYFGLADGVRRELAEMRPRDRIDVQRFIWVVGDYQQGREAVYE